MTKRHAAGLLIAAMALVYIQALGARAQTSPPTIGVPAVDSFMVAVTAHDLDAVTAAVELSPRGCVPASEATVGSPPTCGPEQTEGTPIPSLFFAQCEGTFMISTAEVRTAVSNLFAKSEASAVYAVARGGVFDQPQDGYLIAVSPGTQPSGDVTGTIWYVTSAGKLQGVDVGCPPQTLGQHLASFTPPPEFVVAPIQVGVSPTPEPTVALPNTGVAGSNSNSMVVKIVMTGAIGVGLLLATTFLVRRLGKQARN